MKKEQSILSVKDLSVGYQSKKNVMPIASNINFNLNTGELVGLVGANGIGKSTLLRTLTQLQPALSGEIYINNKPLSSYSNSILATQLSLVLTDKSLSKNLSVFELVALGRQPYTNWIGKLTETDIGIPNIASPPNQ